MWQQSFRTQIFQTYVIGIVIVAFGTALVTSTMATRLMRAQVEAQAGNLAHHLAENSVFALLSGSVENAGSAAETLAFPGIEYVSVRASDGRAFYEKGQRPPAVQTACPITGDARRVSPHETPAALYFTAPVVAKEHATTPLEPGAEPIETIIGYVCLGMDKSELGSMQKRTFLNSFLATVLIATLLLFVLLFVVNRLTEPLLRLSRLMSRGVAVDDNLEGRAPATQELRVIVQAYRRLLDTVKERDQRLKEHAGALEEQVQVRTHELAEARDNALRANRVKSEFVANVSHELRTPLQAIIGHSEILLSQAANPGLGERATTINQAAEHLLALVEDLLDLSKMEANRLKIQFDEVVLSELLDGVRREIEPGLKPHNRLRMDIDPQISTLQSDKTRLTQILINLLSNANKYTRAGEIHLRVFCPPEAPERVMFEVCDTGIGISAPELPKIFDNFYRVEHSGDVDTGGAGIGLALTRYLCDLLGGSISVQSNPGRGSCFRVSLPRGHRIDRAAQRDEHQAGVGRSLSVLIAEDNALVRDLLVEMLQAAGHRVRAVDDGAAMLDILGREAEHIDIAILDHQMPRASGLEVIRQTRAAALTRMPMIVLTAGIGDAVRQEYAELGVTVVNKPVRAQQLLDGIEAVMALATPTPTQERL